MVAVGATAWHASHSLRRFHQEQMAADLLARAQILAGELPPESLDAAPAAAERLCRELGRTTHTRFTVILPAGRVIGDSEQDPALMENHADRPEIAAALRGGIGKSVRFSDTRRQRLMYLAVPVHRQGAVVGVVRASVPLAAIDRTLHVVYLEVLAGGLIVAAVFALIAFWLSTRLSRPLEEMRRVAEKLAAGDLTARAPVPGDDTGALARALNDMAAQLGERMRTITEQRSAQEAVFASMGEGVLAVDRNERVLHFNPAAARLIGLPAEQIRGRTIQEVARNPDLQAFVAAALSGAGVTETDIVLYGDEERFLQLHGTALTDTAGARIGAVIVMNDVTRLKRLETVRRDFVANLSHELKTPITAIRGCVETLTEGAVKDPAESRRFLDMMARHVNRLGAMVEDLLSLSRIEFDAERGRIPLEPGPVGEVLQRAVQTFAGRADAKNIALAVNCPEDATGLINAPLLEQAVGNLIDNAIKYSGDGTRVEVIAAAGARDVEIRVADQGPGIEKKHLPRIFERFYRVDQARSRALGGTGLGLAIVKHIVLAHHGSVSVDSAPGRGTTFTIRIPRSPAGAQTLPR
jgi:two-component system phosphate regulon sensor histidine kinase PhoR